MVAEQEVENKGLEGAINSRRTFAIISHPDAGKTTLTEKLLLYSGMIRTAGMVRGRKGRKAASSDWMAMEQERGISITASAMQFYYRGATVNVLDTPGHQDFSEDTYRTLTAADSAIMVIDAAKGVETQTRKLFQVCRMRGIPILTFINKMDLPGREPLDLIHEVEEVLGIEASPMNWPIGSGKNFKGVVECASKRVLVFEKTGLGGATKAECREVQLSEALSSALLTPDDAAQVEFDLELLREAGNDFRQDRFLKGEVTPVFFGSALTNFGLEPFFNSFIDLAPCPHPRKAIPEAGGEEILIDPLREPFSAYVFKIQANMDPRHRDSMAFLRLCSGELERDCPVKHIRTGREIRLSRSHAMLGGERQTVDAAYPGDIVGVINPGVFEIGDTISIKGGFHYLPMPEFPPEVVARIRPKDASKRKAFDKGMKQIASEGAVQVLEVLGSVSQDPVIAAVGKLQFEVVEFRLKNEYKVETVLDILPYNYGAWLEGNPATFDRTSTSLIAKNTRSQHIVLFQSEWEKSYSQERNPNHKLVDFMQQLG